MKAIVVEKANKVILKEVPIPNPDKGYARIKVSACAICATDLELIGGNIPANYPIIPGHEWSGVVDAVSDDSYSDWLEKPVTGSNDISCLTCDECKRGNIRYCKSFEEIGFRRNGAYAEYLTVPVHNLVEIPEGISFEEAALSEPLAVAIGVLEKAQARLGETLLIFGAGSIGLCILVVAKAMGLNKITVCASSQNRLDIAKKMGAFRTLASNNTNIIEEMKKIHPDGTDIVCDATGMEECIVNGIKLTRKGGRLLLAGYSRGKSMNIRIDDIHVNNIKVIGAGNNWNVHKKAVALMESHAVDISMLITERIQLHQYKYGLELARTRPFGFVKAVFVL